MIPKSCNRIWKKFMKREGPLKRKNRRRLGKKDRLKNSERNRGICIRSKGWSPVGLSPGTHKPWMTKFNKSKNNPKSTTRSNSPTPSPKWMTMTTTCPTTIHRPPTTTLPKRSIPTKRCKANSQTTMPTSSPNPSATWKSGENNWKNNSSRKKKNSSSPLLMGMMSADRLRLWSKNRWRIMILIHLQRL